MIRKTLAFCALLSSTLCGKTFETFFGPIDVEEEVLIELIESPAMQRLKGIHQYGVSFYTTHKEEYNRFDHSMGVFAILRKNRASLHEQISGLLHDISHTVFSHVGDWVFGREYQEHDYQSTIYKPYLAFVGIETILLKHGYTINGVIPKSKDFVMLEQPLPNLCADRIDYNIQGAFYQGFLTHDEALELYEDFRFEDGKWISSRADLLCKLVRFSIFMTQDCWGSPCNYASSCWLAQAMLRGIDIGLLSWGEIHISIDDIVWEKLSNSNDPEIQKKMAMLANPHAFFRLSDPEDAHVLVKFRYRAIDPWVVHEGATLRLSSVNRAIAEEFAAVKEKSVHGWPLQFLDQAAPMQ